MNTAKITFHYQDGRSRTLEVDKGMVNKITKELVPHFYNDRGMLRSEPVGTIIIHNADDIIIYYEDVSKLLPGISVRES